MKSQRNENSMTDKAQIKAQAKAAAEELCEKAKLKKGMTAVDFEGTRFDMGSKLGFLTANVIEGAKNPELGEEFRAFLREFAKTL